MSETKRSINELKRVDLRLKTSFFSLGLSLFHVKFDVAGMKLIQSLNPDHSGSCHLALKLCCCYSYYNDGSNVCEPEAAFVSVREH